jgi:hypothetical protein
LAAKLGEINMATPTALNANKLHIKWKNEGTKKVLKYNKDHDTNLVHDVDLLGDIIDDLSIEEQQSLLSVSSILLLKEEVPSIRKDSDSDAATYSSVYTYVGNIVGKKFGPDAVSLDTKLGFRAIKNSREIKDYARDVMKITVDRLVLKGY